MLTGFLQITIILTITVIIAPFLGSYLAQVFTKQQSWLDPIMLPLERGIYRLSGLQKRKSMTGGEYILAVMYSNLIMGILVYLIFLSQGLLPLNPTGLSVGVELS